MGGKWKPGQQARGWVPSRFRGKPRSPLTPIYMSKNMRDRLHERPEPPQQMEKECTYCT